MRTQILISYFYQIRFMKPNMIPLSTAVWDPKWFKYGKDKRGVYNGLRAEPFVPIITSDGECKGPDNCEHIVEDCSFLRNYYKQLQQLNFDEIMQRFETLGQKIKDYEGFEEEPIMVLMVYETPNNPCSERRIIKQWFADNGYELEEFDKNKQY